MPDLCCNCPYIEMSTTTSNYTLDMINGFKVFNLFKRVFINHMVFEMLSQSAGTQKMNAFLVSVFFFRDSGKWLEVTFFKNRGAENFICHSVHNRRSESSPKKGQETSI